MADKRLQVVGTGNPREKRLLRVPGGDHVATLRFSPKATAWPRRVEVEVPGSGFALDTRIDKTDDGRLALRSITIEPSKADGEVLARWLREIPVSMILEGYWLIAQPHLRQRFQSAGPQGYTDEHYESVLADYRTALESHPRKPVARVAEVRGVSVATARRWVREAERRETEK